MKRYYKTLLFIFLVAPFFVSCEDYLDVSPELGISSEEVFTDYFNTRGVVDRANFLIHNYVYFNTDWASELGVMSDECQISQTRYPPHYVFNTGVWMNSNFRELAGMTNEKDWQEYHDKDHEAEPVSKAFLAIRAVNSVLENIDKLQEYPTELGYTPQQLKDQLVGQSYFLRAFHYFQIIRRYGGFPTMTKTFEISHNFDEVRPTYLQSTDSLVQDLDKAIQFLPEKWNDQNKGRVTKTSAKALKAMTLLYAASPLMNPDLNPYGANSRTYNNAYAEKAAIAAAEAINDYPKGGYEMFSMDQYTENWYSRTSGFPKEAILQAPLSRHTDPDGWGIAGMGWFLPQFAGGWQVEGQPTQNAVDWFETADGYDVSDPEAISSGSFDPSDPYSNRDPRFRALILVHGDDMFEGLPNPSNNDVRMLNVKPDGWHYKFETGKNKIFTGYYHKGKHRWPGCDKWNRSGGWYRMFPHIRVAQLYLDYAEAANEAYGPNGMAPGASLSAVQALNIVRSRANMPGVLAKYTTSKDVFRKRIYNERAVELYHEFHRWHDLRRWKLSKEVLGQGTIYGADIKDVGGQTVYEKKALQGALRVFEDRHYWYPFPSKVMDIMTQFEQNPGW
ncbi:RagB/SusD family nutrient uptake outer membrane protein [Flavivirga eckloniae]|nr:RagB/SusD family nutrient uptake outer membrane protein [Flavivirga eckloniae]